MTPHQTLILLDGSIAMRVYPGGRWHVKGGPTNGIGDICNCDASRFVAEQNEHVRDFHRESGRGYLGKGEAA